MSLYEKFGEFDSAEELNMSAAGLLKEGDTESLIVLAKENGIDKEDAKDYIDGCMDVLASPIAAALGKDEKSVHNAVYRIRRKLRCRLETRTEE